MLKVLNKDLLISVEVSSEVSWSSLQVELKSCQSELSSEKFDIDKASS